jgi:hypothetical protein
MEMSCFNLKVIVDWWVVVAATFWRFLKKSKIISILL